MPSWHVRGPRGVGAPPRVWPREGGTRGYPPGPAVDTCVSERSLWGSGQQEGHPGGHKCAAKVGAGGSVPPRPGRRGRNGSAGRSCGRGAEGGAQRLGPPGLSSGRRRRRPHGGSGKGPGGLRAGTELQLVVPARPRRSCSRSPPAARDRRWAVRTAALLLPAAARGARHGAAEETRHILKVLRSTETPLAEKQQVMSNEFEDCCLKMDEGQKSMEKGIKPDVVEVQPSNGQVADAVKQADLTPEAKPELFTSSGSSFRFDFTLSETTPETDPGDSGAEQVQSNVRATKQEYFEALRFAASGQEPKFAFNFAIPDEDCPQLQLLPASQHTEHTADPSLPAESAALPQAAALQKLEGTQATGNAPKEDGSHVTSKISQTETAPADEAVTEKSTRGGAAQKKKKKKQKLPVSKKKTEETETNRKAKAEANSCQNTDTSHQDEKISQSGEQLRKEVDWCVNQLELGLKTQKPTPKQAEEALRAIRTLRSDKAPLVKKRQLMRAMFGDYRKKMQEELCRELKLMETAAKSAKIVEVNGSSRKKNGQFIRKCLGACREGQGSAESPSESHRTLNTGFLNFRTPQEEFRFNFF